MNAEYYLNRYESRNIGDLKVDLIYYVKINIR